MPLRTKIFLAVSLLYILYTVFPLVQTLAALDLWIVNLATFIILIGLYPSALSNKVLVWFSIYALVLAFYVLLGKPLTVGIGTVSDSKKVFIEYGFFLPAFAIFSILYWLNDLKLYRIIAISTLGFLVSSFIYLVPMLLLNSTAMRDAYLIQVEQGFTTPGVPDYTLMHAYVLAVPGVLYGIKKTAGVWKLMLWGALTLLMFIILHTYITTSLLLLIMLLVVAAIYNPDNIGKSIVLLFIALMLVYILHISGVFLQMFDFLLDFFADTAVGPKIESFKYIYLYGDVENSGGHVTGRMDFHDRSWLAFSENFLVGGTSPVGGHSSVLDRLGGMGLLATVPFLMIFIAQARMILLILITAEEKLYYVLGLFAAATLLYQKGLFGQEGWLITMILMPGLILAFRKMVPYGTIQVLVNDNEKRDE